MLKIKFFYFSCKEDALREGKECFSFCALKSLSSIFNERYTFD